MVSRNYKRLGSALESAASGRDWQFFAAAAPAMAVGGVVAADLSSRVLDVFFDTGTPGGTTGLALQGGTRIAAGAGLAGLAAYAGMDNYVGQTLAVAGLGAMALGGGKMVQAAMDLNLASGVIPGQVRRKLSGSGTGTSATRRQLQRATQSNGATAQANTRRSPRSGRTTSAYS